MGITILTTITTILASKKDCVRRSVSAATTAAETRHGSKQPDFFEQYNSEGANFFIYLTARVSFLSQRGTRAHFWVYEEIRVVFYQHLRRERLTS